MLNKSIENFKKKSLKERFLFVMGMLVFIAYFILGLIFIFWESLPIAKSLPLAMEPAYRISFGVLLIVYSFVRFFRIFNLNSE
jgi:hypothetical protein